MFHKNYIIIRNIIQADKTNEIKTLKTNNKCLYLKKQVEECLEKNNYDCNYSNDRINRHSRNSKCRNYYANCYIYSDRNTTRRNYAFTGCRQASRHDEDICQCER